MDPTPMDPTWLVAIEGGFFAVLLLGFCAWQIRDARRASKEREERERSIREDDARRD